MLWARTMSVPLPTHFFEMLSFTFKSDSLVHIVDDGKRREYDAMLAALDKILTRYDKNG